MSDALIVACRLGVQAFSQKKHFCIGNVLKLSVEKGGTTAV